MEIKTLGDWLEAIRKRREERDEHKKRAEEAERKAVIEEFIRQAQDKKGGTN